MLVSVLRDSVEQPVPGNVSGYHAACQGAGDLSKAVTAGPWMAFLCLCSRLLVHALSGQSESLPFPPGPLGVYWNPGGPGGHLSHVPAAKVLTFQSSFQCVFESRFQ